MKDIKYFNTLVLVATLMVFSIQTATAQTQEQTDAIEKRKEKKAVKDGAHKETMETYKKLVEAIENNPDYTPTEKDSLILLERKKLKGEMKKLRKEGKYGMRGKKENGFERVERKVEKAELKKEIERIEADASLSDDEKAAAISAARNSFQKRKPQGKVNSHGNGKQGRLNGDKAQAKQKGKRAKLKKLDKKMDQNVLQDKSPEEIEKIRKRLDKSQRKLDKLKKKGKISDERYAKRSAEIQNILAKL